MIECRDLRVDYDNFTAVHDVSLEIGAGEVYGLIGPNGAGKTSTIRVLATLHRPTYGEVRIGGIDIEEEPAKVHRLLGYMPDMAPVDKDLKCWEFLEMYAGAYAIPRRERRKRIDECLELVSLDDKRDAMAGKLSRGMTQRLVLAKTLIMDPDVMLLDEPASGLDPHARIELREILKTLAGHGKTVLVSSHILTELSEFCTSYGFMDQGRLVQHGTLDEIAARLDLRATIALRVLEAPERAREVLVSMEAVSEIQIEGMHVVFELAGDDPEAAQILAGLLSENVQVVEFSRRSVGVENVTMSLARKNGGAK